MVIVGSILGLQVYVGGGGGVTNGSLRYVLQLTLTQYEEVCEKLFSRTGFRSATLK